MAKHLLWQRQIGRHQERWPIDGVETDNILTDDMDIGRPETCIITVLIGKTQSRQIGRQRIDPHIHDMPWRTRHRHAPIETGS